MQIGSPKLGLRRPLVCWVTYEKQIKSNTLHPGFIFGPKGLGIYLVSGWVSLCSSLLIQFRNLRNQIKSNTTQRKLSGQLPPGVPIFFQHAQIDSRKSCKNWAHRDFQLAGDLKIWTR